MNNILYIYIKYVLYLDEWEYVFCFFGHSFIFYLSFSFSFSICLQYVLISVQNCLLRSIKWRKIIYVIKSSESNKSEFASYFQIISIYRLPFTFDFYVLFLFHVQMTAHFLFHHLFTGLLKRFAGAHTQKKTKWTRIKKNIFSSSSFYQIR